MVSPIAFATFMVIPEIRSLLSLISNARQISDSLETGLAGKIHRRKREMSPIT